MADNFADDKPLKPHDMGGQPAGPVLPDFDGEPVFKQAWHGRALALTLAAGALGKWNLDASRNARERLPAKDYQRFSYYEKWLSGLAGLLIRHQLVSREELLSGNVSELPLQQKTLIADKVRAVMDKGGPSERSMDSSPKFQIGDRVKTLTPEKTALVKNGHTRLPKYAANKNGVIIAYHGGHVLPDSNAHGLGENPEHLYAVKFKSSDIWQDADNRDYVIVDCWESYLK